METLVEWAMSIPLRKSAPAIIILTGAVVILVVVFFSIRMFGGLTAAVEEQQVEMVRTILASALQSAEDRALARAEIFAEMPAIRKLFAARDRQGLLAECGPAFAIQKEKYGVDQMQFHVPPATSFLRMHAPQTFGDDLSVFRPMVTAVNRDQVSRKGLVIAKAGPAIFGVTPLRDLSGAHSGTVDIGLDFGPVLDGLKAAYQFDLVFFVEEEPLRKFATGLGSEVFSEANRRGKYIKFHSTHWDLMQGLVTETDLAKADLGVYTRSLNGVTYGVVPVVLRNPSGEPLGLLVAAIDFSASRAAAGRSLVWQLLLAVFAVVVLAGVVLIVLRGFVFRPLEVLGTRMRQLADGESPPPLEEIWCPEVEEIAGAYEKIRKERAEQRPASGDKNP